MIVHVLKVSKLGHTDDNLTKKKHTHTHKKKQFYKKNYVSDCQIDVSDIKGQQTVIIVDGLAIIIHDGI